MNNWSRVAGIKMSKVATSAEASLPESVLKFVSNQAASTSWIAQYSSRTVKKKVPSFVNYYGVWSTWTYFSCSFLSNIEIISVNVFHLQWYTSKNQFLFLQSAIDFELKENCYLLECCTGTFSLPQPLHSNVIGLWVFYSCLRCNVSRIIQLQCGLPRVWRSMTEACLT